MHLFPGVALLGGNEVGERWNLFQPLPGCQVDLRARHGVTPGEARSVGYRTQPPRVVTLGEVDHRVWGGGRLARRRFVALQKRHFSLRKPVWRDRSQPAVRGMAGPRTPEEGAVVRDRGSRSPG